MGDGVHYDITMGHEVHYITLTNGIAMCTDNCTILLLLAAYLLCINMHNFDIVVFSNVNNKICT